jgi:parallel beta-helix repeat protein
MRSPGCVLACVGVAMLDAGNTTITNSVFRDNTTDGIAVNSAPATIANCTFDGNYIGVRPDAFPGRPQLSPMSAS